MPYTIQSLTKDTILTFKNNNEFVILNYLQVKSVDKLDEVVFELKDNNDLKVLDFMNRDVTRPLYLVDEVIENEPSISIGLYRNRPASTGNPQIYIASDINMIIFNIGDSEWYDSFGTHLADDYQISFLNNKLSTLVLLGII